MIRCRRSGSVKAPLLSLHSRQDEIVPFSHAERLFAAAPGPKKLVELRGDHNSGFATSERIYRAGSDRILPVAEQLTGPSAGHHGCVVLVSGARSNRGTPKVRCQCW